MAAVKHIWFDLAGTLYKETEKFNEVHDRFRYETYGKLLSISDPEQAKAEFLEAYKKAGSNSAVFRALGKPSDFWMKTLNDMDFTAVLEPDPDIYETVAKLKDLVPISIFTNFDTTRLASLLTHLKISIDDFTYVISGDDIKERKPALDGFHLMIEKSQLPANEILYVGDRVAVDIIPAKQVGIKTCLLYDTSPEADYCFENFRDVLSVL